MKAAVIVAATFEVCCPHCDEAQPSPGNGSHLWTPTELKMSVRTRACVACDGVFTLRAPARVRVAS